MEKLIKSVLQSNTNITAIVANKISPIKREEFPSVTYEKTGMEITQLVDGTESDIRQSLFSITARCKTYTQAKDLSSHIKQQFTNFKGTYGNETVLFTQFQDETENQLLEPDIVEISITYNFYHR